MMLLSNVGGWKEPRLVTVDDVRSFLLIFIRLPCSLPMSLAAKPRRSNWRMWYSRQVSRCYRRRPGANISLLVSPTVYKPRKIDAINVSFLRSTWSRPPSSDCCAHINTRICTNVYPKVICWQRHSYRLLGILTILLTILVLIRQHSASSNRIFFDMMQSRWPTPENYPPEYADDGKKEEL